MSSMWGGHTSSEDELAEKLVQGTQREIFDYAVAKDPDNVEYRDDVDYRDEAVDTSLEQVRGFDGDVLGDEEQWETTINGHGDGFDRPQQTAESLDYETQLAERATEKQTRAENREVDLEPGRRSGRSNEHEIRTAARACCVPDPRGGCRQYGGFCPIHRRDG